MSTYVIDASVAAKWFLPSAGEPLAGEAFRLLRSYADGQIQFRVPGLFWAECANVMWKAVRQRRWSRAAAEQALREFVGQNLPTTPSRELLQEAFDIAATFDRTVYDSLYLALALRLNAPLVTADGRLADGLAAHLPVKWLGSLWT